MSFPSRLLAAVLGFLLLPVTASCGRDQRDPLPSQPREEGASPSEPVPPQTVISWVAAYAIGAGKRMFSAEFGGIRPVDTLTRLGLQFWTLRSDGSIEWLDAANAEHTQWFVREAHARGIDVLLTVVNDGGELGQPGFHWQVLRDALRDDGVERVAEGLLNIVEQYDLDGVDLDLEAGGSGVGPYTDEDRHMFSELVNALAGPLHEQDRLLTVDTFTTNNGVAPGPSWWADWVGRVDAIHAMGYMHSFKNGPAHRGYQYLLDQGVAAGFGAHQILPALPVWLNAWAGDESNSGISHRENLLEIAHCLSEPTGVALWALHHPETEFLEDIGAAPWTTGEPWQVVREIQLGHPRDASVCDTKDAAEEGLIDDLRTAGANRLGGLWLAVTDFWDRPVDERDQRTSVLNQEGDYDLALGEGGWGNITRGYHTTDGLRLLSAHVISGTGPAAYGGLWMEFLPRDCDQLDNPSDGCGWRQEALVGIDLSEAKSVVVGARCHRGEVLTLALQSRSLAIEWEAPYSMEIECSGNFEDYRFDLKKAASTLDLTEVTTLRLELHTEEAGTELHLDVLGVALDESVLELRELN